MRNAEALLLCLSLASAAAMLAVAIALLVALAAARLPGPGRALVLLASDTLLAVPGLFLLMMARASLPLDLGARTTALVTFLLIAVLGWPIMVRTILAELGRHAASGWMLMCRAQGLSPARIYRTHVMCHLAPLIRTHFLIALPAFLAAEANLGVLGLGVPDPLPSWGGMLAQLTQSSLVMASRWRYLPAAMLIGVLLLLDLAVHGAGPPAPGDAHPGAPAYRDRGEHFETLA